MFFVSRNLYKNSFIANPYLKLIMCRISKSFSLLFIVLLAVSGLNLTALAVKPVSAQSTTASPPTFTFKFVDNSYYVPPTTTSTTDPYTGKVTTTPTSGYYVQNKTIEAIIKNNGASYYNFRYKGHYADEWSYYPFNPTGPSGYNFYDGYSVPNPASSTDDTIIEMNFLPKSVPAGGEVDVQIQGLFGSYNATPYGHFAPLPAPTYDFVFNGTISD